MINRFDKSYIEPETLNKVRQMLTEKKSFTKPEYKKVLEFVWDELVLTKKDYKDIKNDYKVLTKQVNEDGN